MAHLARQQIKLVGPAAEALVAAAAGGDTFDPDSRTFLKLNNPTGGALTATVANVRPSNHGDDVDLAYAIPAGENRLVGPFDRGRFGNPAAAMRANLTYSAVGLTVGVFRV